MKIRKFALLVAISLVMLALAGCDVGDMALQNELEHVINGYGQALVADDLNTAMSHISKSYYDDNGVDYGERRTQAALALLSGEYLAYSVQLSSVRSFGDEAYVTGSLSTIYILVGTSVAIRKTEDKAWTLSKEFGRWRISSERALHR